jgi:probable phosphoglycerate mutase
MSAGVLLARHGETDDNREPIRVQGFRDTPLNDVGRAQARALGERLMVAGEPVRAIWSSDLVRASETASIVAGVLAGVDAGGALEVQLDRRLREAHRGRWEGHLFVDIAREEPELYAAWRRAGASFRFPDGESLLEQQQRVSAAVADVRARGELPALVVCHGGAIRVMLSLDDARGLDAFHDFEVPNTGVFPV